jgi:hypothetical protein
MPDAEHFSCRHYRLWFLWPRPEIRTHHLQGRLTATLPGDSWDAEVDGGDAGQPLSLPVALNV